VRTCCGGAVFARLVNSIGIWSREGVEGFGEQECSRGTGDGGCL